MAKTVKLADARKGLLWVSTIVTLYRICGQCINNIESRIQTQLVFCFKRRAFLCSILFSMFPTFVPSGGGCLVHFFILSTASFSVFSWGWLGYISHSPDVLPFAVVSGVSSFRDCTLTGAEARNQTETSKHISQTLYNSLASVSQDISTENSA